MKSFSELCDVARGFELSMEPEEETPKRKFDGGVHSPSKKFWASGSGGSPHKKPATFCRRCNKVHSGECRTSAPTCFNCGKTGHKSHECRSKGTSPIVCFNCQQEGHMKNMCPLLSEEEKKQELRKEVERRIAKTSGTQRGRSFQMTVDEAKDNTDVVAGTFIVENLPAKVLFDSGANYSFIAKRFAKNVSIPKAKLGFLLEVEVANDAKEYVNEVYKNCQIKLYADTFRANLIPMP